MRRYHFLTLVIFAILVVEGCSRARPKREAVSVGDEKHMLPDDSRELIIRTEPARVISLGLETPRGPDGNYTFPEGTFGRNVEIKWINGKTEEETKAIAVIKTQYEDKKHQIDVAKREQDLKELGKLFLVFCQNTEPAERTFDNLRKDVRRSDNLVLLKMFKDKTIEAALDADTAKPDDVVAYFPSALKEWHAYITVKGSDNEKVKVPTDKLSDLEVKLRNQRLRAIQKVYKAYVDNNPDERSYKELKAYLEKNLVAAAYEAHLKGEILLLDPEKPKGKAKAMPPIACYAKDDGKDKGHLGISLKGGITSVSAPLPVNYLAK